MKKLSIAAFLIIALASAGIAQTKPTKKASSKAKTEVKKDAAAASDTTTMHKHHKAMKHAK